MAAMGFQTANQVFRTDPTDRSLRSPLSDCGLTYHMGAATQLTRTGQSIAPVSYLLPP